MRVSWEARSDQFHWGSSVSVFAEGGSGSPFARSIAVRHRIPAKEDSTP